jgi:hypothetical protein
MVYRNPYKYVTNLINLYKNNAIVHVIPQVSKMKAYIFNYKIHVHEIMLCMIFY